MVFPDSSVGEEYPCNAGDPGLIPGSGRSAGEGIGYPFQYSWASLVAQPVKKPSAMKETWVPSLGWEDPVEKGKATHSSILDWRIPWTVQSMGSQRVGHTGVTFTFKVRPWKSATPPLSYFTYFLSSKLQRLGLQKIELEAPNIISMTYKHQMIYYLTQKAST